ncbi:MAG: SpoIIE family protein phosphatase [Planctomycetota bacterium]|jgi:sigma-B regulation protein RsbU (phosphoserine phosphatase)
MDASPTTDPPADPSPAPKGVIQEHPTRVLLVDDQLIIGEAVRRMLQSESGIEYRYCQDPTTALDVAREFQPTVILSDLVMPQMDGLDLVRKFRAHEGTQNTPLIVLSSKEEATTKAEAFSLGANDYLVKLPDPVELLARIRYHSEGYIHLIQRNQAYSALKESQRILAEDLEQAARYVRSLLPAPEASRVKATWRFIPSASLGGDTFGYHWLDEDHFVMFLLDVSGHGVGAALLSVSVLNLLRSQALRNTDFRNPGEVLTRLNDTFRLEDQGGKFFTIWYGVFRVSTREILYCGGGHPAAILASPEVPHPTLLSSSGPMPGAVPGIVYETGRAEIHEGARLLLFSDGVYEIRQASGVVATFESFVDELTQADVTEHGPLAWAMTRATRLRVGDGFDDDVSLVQFDFP